MMTVKEFVQEFKDKKIQNTKVSPNAVEEHIIKTLEIKEYIPFQQKRAIAEVVANKNIKFVDGVKKHDAVSGYISFIIAMLTAHTSLEISNDPFDDYDILAASGLLEPIISTFKKDYDECDVVLKMVIASELEDNNINITFGRFLNSLADKLDALGSNISKIDWRQLLGGIFKQEDLAKLSSFLNKYNK